MPDPLTVCCQCTDSLPRPIEFFRASKESHRPVIIWYNLVSQTAAFSEANVSWSVSDQSSGPWNQRQTERHFAISYCVPTCVWRQSCNFPSLTQDDSSRSRPTSSPIAEYAWDQISDFPCSLISTACFFHCFHCNFFPALCQASEYLCMTPPICWIETYYMHSTIPSTWSLLTSASY